LEGAYQEHETTPRRRDVVTRLLLLPLGIVFRSVAIDVLPAVGYLEGGEEGGLVDPRLRASNEHILIVRVPRAGGRPAPSRENNKQAWKEHHGARSRAV